MNTYGRFELYIILNLIYVVSFYFKFYFILNFNLILFYFDFRIFLFQIWTVFLFIVVF